MSYFFYLREYLFPSGCGGCGKALLGKKDAFYGLCTGCRELLTAFLTGEKRCVICGKPLITEKETCLSCRGEDSQAKEFYSGKLVKLYAAYPYTGKFKKVLGAYKFGKSLGVGNFLTLALQRAAKSFGLPGDAAWVPVPPKPGKIKKSGWDQIEYLARRLDAAHRRAAAENLPVCRCLKRLSSRNQKELNREERGKNLKGRILCVKKPPRTAIIFDDVITTGATLNACAAALLENGAEKVYGVCLFYD